MTPFDALIGTELELVEKALQQTLTGSDLEASVNALCLNMVNAGGKRIRPAMVLLCAKAAPYYDPERDQDRAVKLAAAVELLHTATLIHDDVIDNSSLRRGIPTINSTDGNHAAVLAGDYLFTRCFNLLKQLNSLEALGAISDTIATLVSGELMQLKKERSLDLTREDYDYTIYCKTGALFELSAAAFAVLNQRPHAEIEPLKAYGRAAGCAFQIADDNLDYAADSKVLGKEAGTDLADGRITLPVLIALERSTGAEREDLVQAVAQDDFAAVKAAIERTGALEYCAHEALLQAQAAKDALAQLPDSPYKEALALLAENAVKRGH